MEMFDYHYGYVDTEGKNLVDKDVGDKFTKYRVEAAQSLDKRRSSRGGAPSLFPGGLVTLEKHPESGENAEYLITNCSHDFEELTYRSGASAGLGYVGQLRDDAKRPPVPRSARHA